MSIQNIFQYPEDGTVDSKSGDLTNFSEEDLRRFYSMGEVKQHAAGETVLTEGDQDSSVYIVLEGETEVSLPRKNGRFKVASLAPGSVFGELSFFDGMPRSARVSVVADCALLKISEDSFQKLLTQDPRMALDFVMGMGKVLSLRLRSMNQLVQTLMK